jgi:hypothetical protein
VSKGVIDRDLAQVYLTMQPGDYGLIVRFCPCFQETGVYLGNGQTTLSP